MARIFEHRCDNPKCNKSVKFELVKNGGEGGRVERLLNSHLFEGWSIQNRKDYCPACVSSKAYLNL